MTEQALVLRPDMPLMSASEASDAFASYQELREAILDDNDYMWFVEFQGQNQAGRPRLQRFTYPNRAEAEAFQKTKPGSTIKKRMVKSACRKMAKFFGYEIPDLGMGETSREQIEEFTVSVEKGEGYCHTEWLDKTLKTVKASTTISIRSPNGRTWLGKGGAHQSEGFADFAVGETSFTRAVNRAVLDAVGFGDESAEEMPESDPMDPAPGPRAAPRGPAAQPSQKSKEQRWADNVAAGRQQILTHAQEENLTPEFMVGLIGSAFGEGKRLHELPTENLATLWKLLKNPPDSIVIDPQNGQIVDVVTGVVFDGSMEIPPALEPEAAESEEAEVPDAAPAAKPTQEFLQKFYRRAEELKVAPRNIEVPKVLGSIDEPITLVQYLVDHTEAQAMERLEEWGRQQENPDAAEDPRIAQALEDTQTLEDAGVLPPESSQNSPESPQQAPLVEEDLIDDLPF